MKKFLLLFISFILIFNFTVPSYANLIDVLKEVSVNDNVGYGGDLTGDVLDLSKPDNQETSKPNAILRIIIDIFESLLNIITKPLKDIIMLIFPTVEDTIWAESQSVQLTFFNASVNPLSSFGDSFRNLVGSVYNGLRYLVAAIYVIILVYLGIRMILSSVGRQKAHYKMMLQYWLMGLLLLIAFHWVMAFIIWISYQLTFAFAELGRSALATPLDAVTDGIDAGGAKVTGFILNRLVVDAGVLAPLIPALGVLLSPIWLIVGLIVYIVYSLVIFFTYIKRLFTIALLIVLFPLVVLSYVFDKMGDRRAQTFSTWVREFTVNVFIQPIHAFLLSIVAFLFASLGIFKIPILGTILCLGMLALIPMGEKTIKSLFQINSSMGPGNGGIAGSLAHAGMALDTLKRGANSLVNMKRDFTNLKGAQDFKNKMLNKASTSAADRAEAKARRKGVQDPDKIKEIRDKAGARAKDDLLKDPKYKAEIKKRTGHNSIEEAKANMARKLGSKALGASAGVGVALGTGKNVVSSGIAGAAVAGTLSDAAHEWKQLDKPLESPELEQAEHDAKKGNLDKLTDAEKENMSKVLGINKSLINESTPGIKGLINDRIKGRKEALKYGINFDNPLVNNFNPDYDKAENIKRGKEPDGSGTINWDNYDRAVTKTGTYIRNKNTNEIIQVGDGHPNASDDAIWESGSDKKHSEFAAKLDQRAIDYADSMASRYGFNQDDDRYKNILKDQRKKNDTILAAHSACCDHLMDLGHNMIDRPPFKPHESISARINTIDDARQKLSPEDFSKVTSMASTYADDMVYDPNNAAASKANILKKVSALEAGVLPVSVQKLCENAGCTYESFKQGTCDVTQFQAVTQAIQREYQQAPKDIQVAVSANIHDMETRANATISTLFGDNSKTVSMEGIATAVSTVTGTDVSNLTSTQLQSYMTGLNVEQKQQLVDNINLVQQAEYTAMPNTSKIISASNQGMISTGVDISSAPSNLAQAFNVAPGEKVLVSTTVGPINPSTGMATVTVASPADPSKQVTFEAPIDTGGAQTDIYAGELSMDANGNIQMFRSEKTVDYTFTPPTPSNGAQPFYEFGLDELQQMCGNTDTTFSIIKYDNICAIMDSNGNFRGVKRGSEQAKESDLVQYTVTRNSNGELEYTTGPTDKNFWKLHIAAKNSKNPDDVSLIKQLLNVK